MTSTMKNRSRQNGKASLKVSAGVMALIGKDLLSDNVVAISELVKNAYDADATEVVIRFEDVTGPSGSITLIDDGCGMTGETIRNIWSKIGASSKRKGDRTSRKGRRMLGEKGVGRFGAGKLGNRLRLATTSRGEASRIISEYDWTEFYSDKDLDEISIPSFTEKAAKSHHGTELHITDLRDRWNERDFRKMCARLCRLISPLSDRDAFRIILESDEFPDYAGELRSDILKKAPYRIEAEFDGDSQITMKLNGARAATQPWNGNGDLLCGPVSLRVYAFDLDTEGMRLVSRAIDSPVSDVRAWLKEWSGISIYRDGFRLWPYGEPNDDWLRLDQRRVNNPAERLSNNQVVGFIDISRKENPDLVDQTNREGLISNRAMADLRRLTLFVLNAMETERYRKRRSAEAEAHKQSGQRNNSGKNGSGKLTPLQEAVDRAVTDYADLAALGSAAGDICNSLTVDLADIKQQCAALDALTEGTGSRPKKKRIRAITDATDLIEQKLKIITPLTTNSSRRSRTIDVTAETLMFKELVGPRLEEESIRLAIDCEDDQKLHRVKLNPEDFHRTLNILFANSVDWLRGISSPRIRIRNERVNGRLDLTFSDNGTGIPTQIAGNIFEPGFSRKERGRGMGLAIAERIVTRNFGTIELVKDGRRKGATFRISFPLR